MMYILISKFGIIPPADVILFSMTLQNDMWAMWNFKYYFTGHRTMSKKISYDSSCRRPGAVDDL